MKLVLALLIVFSLVLSSVAAADYTAEVELFTPQILGQSLPEKLQSLLRNEVVVGHVEDFSAFGVTSEGVFREIGIGTRDDVTLHLYTSEEVASNLLASDDPLNDFLDALMAEEITHKGVGIISTVKFGLLFWAARVFG